MDNIDVVIALEILKNQILDLSKWSAWHNDAILEDLEDLKEIISKIEKNIIDEIEKEEHEELKKTFQSVPYEGGDI